MDATADTLLDLFPNFDYRQPKSPWLLDYRLSNNITGAQMTAFHYYWAVGVCQSAQMPGLSLVTPRLPYCLCVSSDPKREGVQIFAEPKTAWKLFEPGSFPLLVVSAALPLLPCETLPQAATPEERQRARCNGNEVVKTMTQWASLLIPKGVMIGILLDETYAREGGWNIFSKGSPQHAWTPERFEKYIVKPLGDVLDLMELDTL